MDRGEEQATPPRRTGQLTARRVDSSRVSLAHLHAQRHPLAVIGLLPGHHSSIPGYRHGTPRARLRAGKEDREAPPSQHLGRVLCRGRSVWSDGWSCFVRGLVVSCLCWPFAACGLVVLVCWPACPRLSRSHVSPLWLVCVTRIGVKALRDCGVGCGWGPAVCVRLEALRDVDPWVSLGTCGCGGCLAARRGGPACLLCGAGLRLASASGVALHAYRGGAAACPDYGVLGGAVVAWAGRRGVRVDGITRCAAAHAPFGSHGLPVFVRMGTGMLGVSALAVAGA